MSAAHDSGGEETAVGWSQEGEKLDQDIFDALTGFITMLLRRGEKLSEEFGVPGFCVKAMHALGESLPMKELGQRMHCDPSFVTMIADTLEKRGLARREPNPADRRIKNLVLTAEGLRLKNDMERALLQQMPWANTLDTTERQTLLTLIRKMTDPAEASDPPLAPAGWAGPPVPPAPGTP